MAAPRLLLFGPPGAGKSALLDAATTAAPLDAKPLSASNGVQRVHLKPTEKGGEFVSDVTVLDVDGQAALEMLERDEPFGSSHPMRKPVLDADALVLTVDVSASKRINEDFKQAA